MVTDQKSLTLANQNFKTPQVNGSISLVKEKDSYEKNYILHRIKLDPIEVSSRGRDAVLKSLDSGKRFVQLGEYTIMLNTISSIEPLPMISEKRKELLEKVETKKKYLGIE